MTVLPIPIPARELAALIAGHHPMQVIGLESRLHPDLRLDPTEETALRDLRFCAQQAVHQAGPGAWCEHKPASMVLHTAPQRRSWLSLRSQI